MPSSLQSRQTLTPVSRLHRFLLLLCKLVRVDLAVDGIRVELGRSDARGDVTGVLFEQCGVFSHSEHRHVILLIVALVEVFQFAIVEKVVFFASHEVFGLEKFIVNGFLFNGVCSIIFFVDFSGSGWGSRH